ncbi:hypothetical protein [Paenibacillus luteus]|uniref:hypothetical protein n=1 Tax=Paenibacillus luteus TaxID=2545753 RepID=UPI001376044F|nr:hypothetical protein [Paenibacillus luteus]
MNSNYFFWSTLLRWFNYNCREFPWRISKNPFHVLIAEYLLQQTHVRKVESVYWRLIELYPTPENLSAAVSADIKKIIAPLGLSYRADRLHAAGIHIYENFNGIVPSEYSELISMRGIGDYIANAVLCYGFGQNTIPIDTNVIRLFTRYFNLSSHCSRPRTDKRLVADIRDKFPRYANYKNYNLAILDFAGLVCVANNPQCNVCPMAANCLYNKKTISTYAKS